MEKPTLRHRNLLLVLGLVTVLFVSLFFAGGHFFAPNQNSDSQFFVGVEIGWRCSVADCKALIDKVKDYTNLLIIASPTITCDEAALNETCDYAYNAGMYLMVYFGDSQYSPQEVTIPNRIRYTPYMWIMQTKETYGDHFLGAYCYDERGGSKLDSSYGIVIGGNPPSTYMDAANLFVQGTNSSLAVFLNSSREVGASVFTSDYGLYWFDYKGGYDVVLGEFGWNHSRSLHVALCRGAAKVQNKDWGIMITWTYNHPPYLESGPQLYDDLVLAYDSGAKYVAVYDASEGRQNSTLTEEHFDALKNFWDYVQLNPDKHGSLKADAALVLPQYYGFGFRTANDSIWGFKQADIWTRKMYDDVYGLLDEYGSSLDIVYSDPAFDDSVADSYSEVLTWTTGTDGDSYPVVNLNNTMGYSTIQEAINSYTTYDGHTLSVKAGTYHENVVVNKSISLIGEDKGTTIICGDNKDTALEIVCDSVHVSGFTVRDGGNVTSGLGGGICLINANNCILSENIVKENIRGIYLQDSGGTTLRNNSIYDNMYNFGVSGHTLSDYVNDVDSSNTVNGKAICYWINKSDLVVPSDAGYVAIVNCTGITAQNLNFVNNGNGLLVVYTKNSTIADNTFTSNWEGIRLDSSSGNIFRNNDMHGNRYNFWFSGGLENDVDTSNRVNGKPIYYWFDQHDKTVPSDAGYITLINCTGITVQNLQLSNNSQGILLVNTSNSTITQNTIMNQFNGIEVDASPNNIITQNILEANIECGIVVMSSNNSFSGNTVTGSKTGIDIKASSGNNIYGNNITANFYGIRLQNSIIANSSYNTVIANSITANYYHISIEYDAQNNTLYHNNVSDNTEQISETETGPFRGSVSVRPIILTNSWDNGTEGNYWSDYNGTDSDGDGIGDTPYIISTISRDNYPLMQPFTVPNS